MGRRVAQRRRPVKAWLSRHWEIMLIVVPVGAMALVASILAATTI